MFQDSLVGCSKMLIFYKKMRLKKIKTNKTQRNKAVFILLKIKPVWVFVERHFNLTSINQ